MYLERLLFGNISLLYIVFVNSIHFIPCYILIRISYVYISKKATKKKNNIQLCLLLLLEREVYTLNS